MLSLNLLSLDISLKQQLSGSFFRSRVQQLLILKNYGRKVEQRKSKFNLRVQSLLQNIRSSRCS